MFVVIGTFLAGIFGKKLTDTAARAVGIAALAALAAALIALFFTIHDHRVIASHDAGINAQVSNSVVAADRDAGTKKEARDQDFGNSQAAVTTAVNNAVAAAPAEVKKPVGPASQSYYRELRRQQQLKKGKH